ncbi:MAG: hypothetical protein IPL46_16365 [Saprospiraceae bacterium]|nr:hypothetical protein [Saprospiraceae bacterium]
MEETLINGKPLSFYLRHPGALKIVERVELLKLADRYPFSAHLHLLLTVKDHLENNATNRDLLERAALYISDRRKLGEWMNKLQDLRQDDAYLYGKEHLEALSESLETLEPQDEAIADDSSIDDLAQIGDVTFATEEDESLIEDDVLLVEKVPIPEQSLLNKKYK